MDANIRYTPWDSEVLGMDTYELTDSSDQTLSKTTNIPGHFTVKVDPLSTKQYLHEFGFYYCDTLLKPCCRKDQFLKYINSRIRISEREELNDLLAISNGAYRHGRFHRDFNVGKPGAHKRYDRWLSQLYKENVVWGLLYDKELAGFAAIKENGILLYALKEKFRGRGLGKSFFSSVCDQLFQMGNEEIYTSVSACNLAMINMVMSVGFRIKEVVDVYHKFNPEKLKKGTKQ
ncbi:MAG TPA: GNAT family N-acetyltransferase [Bacillales bacterium]|nr:GNAT family N-acetyltransferase [Bacillales bacterium]